MTGLQALAIFGLPFIALTVAAIGLRATKRKAADLEAAEARLRQQRAYGGQVR